MKVCLCFIVILCGLAGVPAQAQVNDAPLKNSIEPAWVIHKQNGLETLAIEEGPRSEQHFLLSEQQVDLETQSYYSRYAYQIMSEEGLANGAQLTINYNPKYQQLIVHRINVYREGDLIDLLATHTIDYYSREEGLESQLYDGRLTANVVLEDIRVGDIIEYAYTHVGENPIFGGKFSWTASTQWASPVDYSLIRVHVPNGRKLHVREVVTESKMQHYQKEGYHEYVIEQTDIAPVYSDGDLPYGYDVWGWIEFSEYADYGEVVVWDLELWSEPQVIPPFLQKKIDALQLLDNPQQQALEALRFVQSEFRYTGIFVGPHSYKPYSLEQICERRFGDCKDKTRLLVTLLKELGLDAYPASVNTRHRHAIIDWLPSPLNFNHAVTLLELDGERYWLDPTANFQGGPLRDIYFPDYGWALPTKPGVTALVPIEPQGYEQRRTRTEEFFDLGDYDERHRYSITTYYFGQDADSMRSYVQRNRREEIERDYLDYYEDYYLGIEQDGPFTFEDDFENNIFISRESYWITQPWHENESKPEARYLYYYASLISDRIGKPDKRNRSMPFSIPHPRNVEQSIQVLFPESIDFEPDKLEVVNPAFTYSINHYTEGKTLHLNFAYRTHASEVSAAATAQYFKDVDQAEDSTSYSVWVHKDGLDYVAPEAETYFNWTLLYFALMNVIGALALGCWLLMFAQRRRGPPPLPPAYNVGPAGIGGWLILPAIGLALSPIIEFFGLWNYVDYFDLATMQQFSVPGADYFSPTFEATIYFEFTASIFFCIIYIIANILFYQHKRIFPVLYIGLALSSLFFLVADYALCKPFTFIDISIMYELGRDIFRTLIHCLIWIPYFLLSKRVKATFVR